jgi:hypothetical protein
LIDFDHARNFAASSKSASASARNYLLERWRRSVAKHGMARQANAAFEQGLDEKRADG